MEDKDKDKEKWKTKTKQTNGVLFSKWKTKTTRSPAHSPNLQRKGRPRITQRHRSAGDLCREAGLHGSALRVPPGNGTPKWVDELFL